MRWRKESMCSRISTIRDTLMEAVNHKTTSATLLDFINSQFIQEEINERISVYHGSYALSA
jgi:ribosomal protein S3AE